MFTGIIETLATVTNLEKEGSNLHLRLQSSISHELKIDQSVAHNGVCLTVVALEGDIYTVTAVQETLDKTSIGQLQVGRKVNLERSMLANSRVDGHFVQGHVDQTAEVVEVKNLNGSWHYRFKYENETENVLVPKGSICIDGTSLTLVEAGDQHFSVAIIPYTYEHTVFHQYQVGTKVNIEFDIIGKYMTKLFQRYAK